MCSPFWISSQEPPWRNAVCYVNTPFSHPARLQKPVRYMSKAPKIWKGKHPRATRPTVLLICDFLPRTIILAFIRHFLILFCGLISQRHSFTKYLYILQIYLHKTPQMLSLLRLRPLRHLFTFTIRTYTSHIPVIQHIYTAVTQLGQSHRQWSNQVSKMSPHRS